MIIKCLFFQRNEDYYDGEYAPEFLVGVDEYSNEENPEWFVERCEKEKESLKDEGVFRVIDIEVSQDQIRSLLIDDPTVKGKVNG